MAMEFFDGAAWRPISPGEAKYRQAEGQGDRLRGGEDDSPSPALPPPAPLPAASQARRR